MPRKDSPGVGRRALLVAGGTGGHLFPALALREVLVRRGWTVHVATDPRVGELIAGVPPNETHRIPSATLSLGSVGGIFRSLSTLFKGVRVSRRLLKRIRPVIVIGFGGYPTVPPAVAARLASVPIVVHEQNAVVGRANRVLIRIGAALATGFRYPRGGERARLVEHVGNPVRRAIVESVQPYEPPLPDEPFHLFVFGGSQGARVFSGLIPGALAQLPEEKRWLITVVQQARPEDVKEVRNTYRGMGVEAVVEPFFNDMGSKLADAQLVICRSGASTVAELSVIGRPAILVPYPHALDQDQTANARVLADRDAAWLMPEQELTPKKLAAQILTLMEDPDMLTKAADAALAEGRVDAAERLADFVESVAERR